MNNNSNIDIQKRLKKIEDRKIEILKEIAYINKKYKEKISKLSSEFSQLDEEYYNLQLEVIGQKYDLS